MSYPNRINVLIVEDNDSEKENYEREFAEERRVHGTLLRFAFCLEEAVRALQEDVPYHVVITDLRIPERHGLPEPLHANYGQEVIKQCEARDRWPIPAILVVSGHLDAPIQRELEERLARNFGFHAIRNRGDVARDLQNACDYARKYCVVGMTHHSIGDRLARPLSARDEDLLRRLTVEKGCIGAHFSDWQTGERKHASSDHSVLVGRFFDDRYDECGYKFFKFLPTQEASFVAASAQGLALKLPHASVFGTVSSVSRTLIVTDKAGDPDLHPASVQDFVQRDPAFVGPLASSFARQVADQLNKIGRTTPNRVLPRDLLGASLARPSGVPAADVCREQIAKHCADSTALQYAPIFETLEFLCSQTERVRAEERTAHGDLNVGNVALDLSTDDERPGVQAFLIDPGALQKGAAARDFAMLETTMLLFLTLKSGCLVDACQGLFDGMTAAPSDPDAANVYRLIEEIRVEAKRLCARKVYASIVFDVAFGQVWGLKYNQSQGNKIRNSADAVRLLVLATSWVRREWGSVSSVDAPRTPGF